MAKLNAAQQAAVDHGDGPLLVLAGAGSGKTRVITERIASLLERGTRPDAILAVSFTNKAAAELVERVATRVGKYTADKLWLSTFHSFGVRFLRMEREALGYGGKFVIFDQGDTLGLVRDIMKREGIGDRKLDASSILTRISLWKNAFKMPDEVPESDFEYDAVARDVYPYYEAALENMRAVDFDDLVLRPVKILSTRPDVRRRWQERFRYMLVDEFQDTNTSQLELVQRLANEQGNVCVVGDDDQSIYGWRGAEIGNILEFERHFEGATVVMLEDNYRSFAPILEVANAAIKRSTGKRHDKTLRAARGPGSAVRLVAVPDAAAEAKLVTSEMRHLNEERVRYGDMAVLYRSNLQARILEEELRGAGIPYRLYGGTQYYDRKEVKDAIAYLRVVVHSSDELSLRRIINYPPRGIGDTSIQRIGAHASKAGISFLAALRQADDLDLPRGAKAGIRTVLGALQTAQLAFADGVDLAAHTRRLLTDVGLFDEIRGDGGTQARRRLENLEHLLRSIHSFEQSEPTDARSIGNFLTRITLTFGAEEEAAGNQVTLSSLHSSKGLEFGVVFFIGLVEGRLPHSRTTDPKVSEAAPSDVEEERRLFYVGVTRARDQLYLIRPERKVVRGRVIPLVPTRFLEGLPEEALDYYTPVGEEPMSTDEVADMASAILAKLGGPKS